MKKAILVISVVVALSAAGTVHAAWSWSQNPIVEEFAAGTVRAARQNSIAETIANIANDLEPSVGGEVGFVDIPKVPAVVRIDTGNLYPDGDGLVTKDSDSDGELDIGDNCIDVENDDQADVDGDGFGDACDEDIDGDGVTNDADNCIYTANEGQEDVDGNGIGDACDSESNKDAPAEPPADGPSVLDYGDGCSLVAAAATNPLVFLLIGIALLPLAWRRR